MSVGGDGPEAARLRQIVDTVANADNIAEFGIGLNGASLRNGSFQEEKKARGNVHIALGDNIYYGGTVRSPVHLDMVIYRPTVRPRRSRGGGEGRGAARFLSRGVGGRLDRLEGAHEMDLLLSGGTIVTADNIFDADIGIEDGRVARLGFDLGPARREIDVSDLYLLPGAVDVHTHVDVEFQGLQSVEDFFSGTVAAACGGVTTLIDYALPGPGQRPLETIQAWEAKARDRAIIDYDFHIAIFEPDDAATLNRMVEVTATNPARLFGLYPRKGTIQVGADADIVAFDPKARKIIRADDMHSAADWDPFEGWELQGWPRKPLSRGEVVVDDGTCAGPTGPRPGCSSARGSRRPSPVSEDWATAQVRSGATLEVAVCTLNCDRLRVRPVSPIGMNAMAYSITCIESSTPVRVRAVRSRLRLPGTIDRQMGVRPGQRRRPGPRLSAVMPWTAIGPGRGSPAARAAVAAPRAGAIMMPLPPWPASQKKPSAASSKPATGSRSCTKLLRPAHLLRIWRISMVVACMIRSAPMAISSSSGYASQGTDGVSSAGEPRMRAGLRLEVEGVFDVAHHRPIFDSAARRPVEDEDGPAFRL